MEDDVVDRNLWSKEPTAARAGVLQEWRSLVVRLARAFARSSPSEFDDLYQVAVEGLFDAVDKYDPEKGVPFSSYASIRIVGTMRDYQRKLDPVPDRTRRAINQLDAKRQLLARELGRPATTEELAEALQWSPHRVRTIEKRAEWTKVPVDERDVVNGDSPESTYLRDERARKMRAAFLRLRTRTRNVVADTILHDRSGNEIAEDLGLTPGRISQLKSKGLDQLRGLMENSDWEWSTVESGVFRRDDEGPDES